jgi:3-deoxy-D-manno-octulosonic-acid transferase
LQKTLPVHYLETFRADLLVVMETSLWPAGTDQEQIELGTSAKLPVLLRSRRLIPSILQI